MDLAVYLTRVGLAAPLEPTVETLRRIHVAHLRAFPFHNLAIQRGETIEVSVEAVAARLLGPTGGGYCFEQNTLLAAALRELGFTVTTLMGRVGSPERRALNHMLLRVDVDGEPWLADVGFGGEGPLEPIPLRDGVRVRQDGVEFSLRRDAHHWTLAIHYGDVSEDLYEFSGLPHTSGDVETANYYASTYPASIFRNTLTVQRVTREERVILRPGVLTRYRNGERQDTPLQPGEVRTLVRELFGIDPGEEPLLYEQRSS